MTQDEIIRMALEACAPNQTFNSDEKWVKRFAALVAAHEREACAKVCEEKRIQMNYSEAPLYAAPQPVMQEPVAWAHPSGGYLSARYMKEFATGLEKETYTIPLYAAPVRTRSTKE